MNEGLTDVIRRFRYLSALVLAGSKGQIKVTSLFDPPLQTTNNNPLPTQLQIESVGLQLQDLSPKTSGLGKTPEGLTELGDPPAMIKASSALTT